MNIDISNRRPWGFMVIGSLLGLISLHGRAAGQTIAENSADMTAISRSTTAPTAFLPPADSKYVIGPDDELLIDVWHEKELSQTIPVRPDGKISLPLLGELPASGQTPLQLQEVITQHLKEYLEHPQVTVIVQAAKSQRVNVVGEVQKPGAYVFGNPVNVVDAVALAGGFKDFAKTKRMYVLRTMPDGTQHRFPVNYNDVIKGKNSSENIILHSHDTVVVP